MRKCAGRHKIFCISTASSHFLTESKNFLFLEDGTDRLSLNVGDCHYMLRNMPGQRRSQVLFSNRGCASRCGVIFVYTFLKHLCSQFRNAHACGLLSTPGTFLSLREPQECEECGIKGEERHEKFKRNSDTSLSSVFISNKTINKKRS
jgi:hypothetical protein